MSVLWKYYKTNSDGVFIPPTINEVIDGIVIAFE